MGCCGFCFVLLYIEKECLLMIIREELNNKSCVNKNVKCIVILGYLVCGKIILYILGISMLYFGVERLNYV